MPSRHDPANALADIIENPERVEKHLAGMDREAFARDGRTRDAVTLTHVPPGLSPLVMLANASIHDFAGMKESRGWSAFADHDGGAAPVNQ